MAQEASSKTRSGKEQRSPSNRRRDIRESLTQLLKENDDEVVKEVLEKIRLKKNNAGRLAMRKRITTDDTTFTTKVAGAAPIFTSDLASSQKQVATSSAAVLDWDSFLHICNCSTPMPEQKQPPYEPRRHRLAYVANRKAAAETLVFRSFVDEHPDEDSIPSVAATRTSQSTSSGDNAPSKELVERIFPINNKTNKVVKAPSTAPVLKVMPLDDEDENNLVELPQESPSPENGASPPLPPSNRKDTDNAARGVLQQQKRGSSTSLSTNTVVSKIERVKKKISSPMQSLRKVAALRKNRASSTPRSRERQSPIAATRKAWTSPCNSARKLEKTPSASQLLSQDKPEESQSPPEKEEKPQTDEVLEEDDDEADNGGNGLKLVASLSMSRSSSSHRAKKVEFASPPRKGTSFTTDQEANSPELEYTLSAAQAVAAADEPLAANPWHPEVELPPQLRGKLSAFTPLKKAKSILKASSFQPKKIANAAAGEDEVEKIDEPKPSPVQKKTTFELDKNRNPTSPATSPARRLDGNDKLNKTPDAELSPLTYVSSNEPDADESEPSMWGTLGAIVGPLFGGFASAPPERGDTADVSAGGKVRFRGSAHVVSFDELREGAYQDSSKNAIIEPPAVRPRRASPVDVDEIQSRIEEGQSVDSSSSSFFLDEASWSVPSITSFTIPTKTSVGQDGKVMPPHLRLKQFERDVSAITIMPSEDISDSGSESECSDSSSAPPSHVMKSFAQDDKGLGAIEEGVDDDDDDEEEEEMILSSDDDGARPLSRKIEKAVHGTDLDDVWIAKQVLDRYGKSRGKNLDNLVDEFCAKMDEFERKVFLKKQ